MFDFIDFFSHHQKLPGLRYNLFFSKRFQYRFFKVLGEKNEKRHTGKRWRSEKKVVSLKSSPLDFLKRGKKKKFEKGGTGAENGWGGRMAHT